MVVVFKIPRADEVLKNDALAVELRIGKDAVRRFRAQFVSGPPIRKKRILVPRGKPVRPMGVYAFGYVQCGLVSFAYEAAFHAVLFVNVHVFVVRKIRVYFNGFGFPVGGKISAQLMRLVVLVPVPAAVGTDLKNPKLHGSFVTEAAAVFAPPVPLNVMFRASAPPALAMYPSNPIFK